jgi:hypothetical protein
MEANKDKAQGKSSQNIISAPSIALPKGGSGFNKMEIAKLPEFSAVEDYNALDCNIIK